MTDPKTYCVDPVAREMATDALDACRELAHEMVGLRAAVGTVVDKAIQLESRLAASAVRYGLVDRRMSDVEDTARHMVTPSGFPRSVSRAFREMVGTSVLSITGTVVSAVIGGVLTALVIAWIAAHK